MKNVLNTILFGALYAFTISCTQDEYIDVDQAQNNINRSDTTIQEIVALGFAEESIVDMGTYYMVGNDLTFSKKGRPVLPEDFGKQSRSTYTVEDVTIGVRIDPALPTNWKTATREAMDHWNANADSGIYFYETDFYWQTSPGVYLFNPEIQVISDAINPLPNYVIAAAEFPTSDRKPGYRIRINLSFNGCSVSNNLRRFNMIHELGHCVSLRHTNEGSVLGTHITGTPTYDSVSVMNGGTACTLSNGFSANDRIAINTVYPRVITSPQNVRAYHDGDEELDVTWNVVPGAVEYKIYSQTDVNSGEFYHYRTVRNNRYSRELKKKYRTNYRILISALNASGVESKFIEPDYSWK